MNLQERSTGRLILVKTKKQKTNRVNSCFNYCTQKKKKKKEQAFSGVPNVRKKY